MPATGRKVVAAKRRPARWFIPRSHRVFGVFDNMVMAKRAVAWLAPEPSGEVWYFQGPEGAAELDPDTVVGPAWAFSWYFSHNIEHLRELSHIVADGQVVVAVPAKGLSEAARVAKTMRAHGGRWSSYTAHGNFVPIC